MDRFSTKELEQIIGSGGVGDEFFFSGVSIDSRTTEAGDCFFAIEGENFDGHDYLSQAFEKGAVCAVVSKDIGKAADEGRIFKVDDTVKALGMLARAQRKRAGFKVVGITGSVGKTTTREITKKVLGGRFKVYSSPKNYNNAIGVPLTLLGAGAGDEVVVAEIGTNRPGEIGYLSGIACPDIAVVINVHSAHLEGLGSVERIAAEKLSIAEGLNTGGVFIVNGDNELLVRGCVEREIEFTSFGRGKNCDIRAENVRLGGSSSVFSIGRVDIELPLAGEGNIENALAAWAVCKEFGVGIEQFAKGVKELRAVSMRAEVVEAGKVTVLNDCYNANPASMRNALGILRSLGCNEKQRLVFICGDMNELGGESERLHRELGKTIADTGVDVLVTVGELAKLAGESAGDDLKVKSFEDADSVCDELEEIIKDNDIILVKGSRSVGLEKVVEKIVASSK